MSDCLEDISPPKDTKHTLVRIVRQIVYQITASYEDLNDADFLCIDPALRLAIGKDYKDGAGQSVPNYAPRVLTPLGHAFTKTTG